MSEFSYQGLADLLGWKLNTAMGMGASYTSKSKQVVLLKIDTAIELFNALSSGSDTPESPTYSGDKLGEPQNPSTNHVSSTGGDLAVSKYRMTAARQMWITGWENSMGIAFLWDQDNQPFSSAVNWNTGYMEDLASIAVRMTGSAPK